MSDIIFLGDYYYNGLHKVKLGEKIKKNLSNASIVFINFEGALANNLNKSFKSGPNLKQDIKGLKFLNDIGVSHITLANNHIMDFGVKGLINTINKLRNFKTIGAGLNQKTAYSPIFERINGKKIGFLAFAENQFGATDSFDKKLPGFAIIDSPVARQAVVKTKTQCDFLILQVHAGLEMVTIPLPEWRTLYREFIDLGVDLIIGHHPHVVQGVEIYKKKKIYYSIGNFYFDESKQMKHNFGALIKVDVNKFELKSEILPIEISHSTIDINMRYRTRIKELSKLINNNTKYKKEIKKIVLHVWKEYYEGYYKNAILGLGVKFNIFSFFKLFHLIGLNLLNKNLKEKLRASMLVHNIQIETHRWVVIHYLKSKYNIK